MPGIDRLHLEDALENAPQTKSLLGVFQKDAKLLRKYTANMQQLCQRILGAQNFSLGGDDSILTSTLQQFAVYLDELSSMHQVLASQLGDGMMYPLNKFLQADLDEVLTMSEMHQICNNDHEQSLARYMKFQKKKEHDQKARQEVNEDLYVYRKKFHQTALHLFSSLNALQYKRKSSLLEPLVGYMEAQKGFFTMGKEAISKTETEDFTSNISASIQGVHAELNMETKKTVEQMDNIEKSSSHLYHADPPPEMPFIPPNLTLPQKAGYLFLRRQALISTKWERCYFFIQGGNLMCQSKEEVAGSLILDLNEEGALAEPADVDDRRHVFHVISPKLKKTVVLQAENLREREEWVATINNVVLEGSYVKVGQARPQPSHVPQQVVQQPVPMAAAAAPPATTQAVMDTLRDTAVAAHNSNPPHPLPSNPAESGFLPDAPISFDLVSSSHMNKSLQSITKEGPPKRINPFDQSGDKVVSENVTDNSAFCQTYSVRFLGSMEVKNDRGEQLILETIRQIMAARAIHNVFKMTESFLMVSSEAMRLVDPTTNTIRTEFSLEDISFWAVHKENKRLFGFITRTRATDQGDRTTFACHVFECNTSAEEICQAIHHATRLAFQVLMEKRNVEKEKYIEQQVLLTNIQNLEEMTQAEKEKSVHPSGTQAAATETAAKETAADPEEEDVDEETFVEPGEGAVGVIDVPDGASAPQAPRLSTDGQYLILEDTPELSPESSQSPVSLQSPDLNPPITETRGDGDERKVEGAECESEA